MCISDLPIGSQYFELVPDGQPQHDLVGRPVSHISGKKHATGKAQCLYYRVYYLLIDLCIGEAVFCDDIPCAKDELYLSLVTSTKSHARLLNINSKTALDLPGVVAFFSARDLHPQQNKFGTIVKDEEVFASTVVFVFIKNAFSKHL
jgi:xanthine dehydrogenase/oxidase